MENLSSPIIGENFHTQNGIALIFGTDKKIIAKMRVKVVAQAKSIEINHGASITKFKVEKSKVSCSFTGVRNYSWLDFEGRFELYAGKGKNYTIKHSVFVSGDVLIKDGVASMPEINFAFSHTGKKVSKQQKKKIANFISISVLSTTMQKLYADGN